jgi:hypothetical protein
VSSSSSAGEVRLAGPPASLLAEQARGQDEAAADRGIDVRNFTPPICLDYADQPFTYLGDY